VKIGAELGRFLRALHAAETCEAVDPERGLPVDFNRRADMETRVPRARENLAQLGEMKLWRAPVEVEEILASAEELPPASGELVLSARRPPPATVTRRGRSSRRRHRLG